MNIAESIPTALNKPWHSKSLSLPAIGALISALLIANGLIFRTYTIAMPSASWEAARQLGLLFVTAEVVVIIYALRQGLDFGEAWDEWPRYLRYCAIFFLAIFWIGGAFYSQVTPFAIAQNIIFVVHPLFAVAVYYSASRVETSGMRKLASFLAIGLSIFCGMIALAFINSPPLATMPNNEIIWQYIIPGFISVRLFGAFCGAVFCFLLVQLLLDEEKGDLRYLPYIGLTVCAAMTIWSGTRNAVLGIAVAMTVMIFMYRVRPARFKSVILLIASLSIASLLAITLVPYNDSAFLLFASEDTATTESISGGRASYWTALWDAYQNVPLFGAGPFASFWILPAGEQIHVQPHNIILQFLVTWGWPATVAALSMLSYAAWRAHFVALKHRAVLPFLAMLNCLLVMSFFDGMFHFAQPLMLIMISFGVIFRVTKMPPDLQSRGPEREPPTN